MIEVRSHGPLILSSTYWGSDLDRAGTLFLSLNAGAVRLLLPSGWEEAVAEMRTGRGVVFSRGPWALDPGRGTDSLELLFEDGTADPYCVHLSAAQADRLPTPEDQGKEWLFTAWTRPRRGKPHKALERPCWYRLVDAIPWLKPHERQTP